ncbi:MAG: D-alanyl-D-alanine carboxypeptidase family protein [Rubrobacteraceae bacterium]|nr:D-alanyl-D-alanine carboxypeptidase [Rubrobacter sp.]
MNSRAIQFALAVFLAVAAFGASMGFGVAYAQDAEETPPPEIAAEAWSVVDLQSGEMLAGENADERLPTGSTSKIMTAITALEMVESGEASLDDEVVISAEAASFATPEYSNAGLVAGDVLSVRELLVGTLVPSGNDAAYALAEHLGGGEGAESVDGFVEGMNALAEELGLEDTSLDNVTGLDSEEHYSSAGDLALMARAGFEHPLFRETVAMPSATITTPEREIPLASVNDLLGLYPLATGVKTGTTPGAGPSLVSSAESGNESYVSVVLGTQTDRYADAVAMLEYGFAAFERPALISEGERYSVAEAPYRRDETVPLVAAEDIEWVVGASSEVEREASAMEDLPDSASRGDTLGEVVLTVDGEVVGETPLVAGRGYEEAPIWQRTWFSVSELLQ